LKHSDVIQKIFCYLHFVKLRCLKVGGICPALFWKYIILRFHDTIFGPQSMPRH
jgi:hypothetical protein